MVPSQPLLAHWFDQRLSLAQVLPLNVQLCAEANDRTTLQGLANCGSGLGGLVFSNSTRALLQSIGVRYTLIINGCISAIVLVPAIAMMKSRTEELQARTEPLELRWLWDTRFFWIWTWGAIARKSPVTNISLELRAVS